MHKSEADLLINKTQKLKISSDNYKRDNKEFENYPMSIFIVGYQDVVPLWLNQS